MRFTPPPGLSALADIWSEALVLATVAALAVLLADAIAPPQDLPWRPLRLADPPGLASAFKFERAAADPTRCRAVLTEGGVDFEAVPARREGRCVVMGAVQLRGGSTALAPAGPVMTCQEALAYVFWARHAVQPAAREQLGSPVARIDHYGTYACRNVRGRTVLSQHAFANALDVAAFRLADGRRISVARDFDREDGRGRFLRQARDGACRWFKVVLGPDYNAAHQDHLHLDRARWAMCR
jgi:hypothetical protein